MNERLKNFIVEKGWATQDASEADLEAILIEKLKSGELSGSQYAELLSGSGTVKAADKLKEQISQIVKEAVASVAAPKTTDVMEKAHDDVHIRVKGALERYDDTRTAGVYKSGKLAGQPIYYNGKPLNKPTERKNKMVAVWLKWHALNMGLIDKPLSEHEQEILQHILHNETFYQPQTVSTQPLRKSVVEELFHKGIDKQHYKADLIDDATSGGTEAVPEFFDQEVIILPVLEGELAPYVTMKDMPRGSAVSGFTMGNVTFGAANAEGTAVSLFDATSFISDYSPKVYRAAGFIQVGRNFLEDAVPGLADEIRQSYTRKHNEWLDRVIAAGNGTTEPQGIINASGVADVTSQHGTAGPVDILDAINLIFAVTAPYRRAYPAANLRFCSTETTYKRFRSLQVGTSDARLVFGNDLGADSPELLTYKVAYESNGMSNSDIFFAQLGAYWLYRRQGLRLVYEDRGSALVRANTVLIGADMRYAGKLTRGGYAAVCDDLYV